ncbi:MAG: hypothetical protein ACLQUZ_05150 [Rhizomicrobium sp.]
MTEGHVRAARWRAVAPFIIGAGVALIVLGLIGIRLLPETTTTSHVAQAKQELVAAQQNALAVFMADKGAPPQVLPADAVNAIAPSTALTTIDSLLAELNASGTLPPETKSMEPEVFWSGNWTPGTVAAVTGERTILIGFYVNLTAAYQSFGRARGEMPTPQLARVFGLFRRSPNSGNTWAFYCLSVPGASPCGRGETIYPGSIPATLRELTPATASP